MKSRPGRKALFGRPYPPGAPKRYLSVPIDLFAAHHLDAFLTVLTAAQRHAEMDRGGPVSLELLAAVQHGEHAALGYTLHFEMTPLRSDR